MLAFFTLLLIVTMTATFSLAKFSERTVFSLKLSMAEHSTFGAGEVYAVLETESEPESESEPDSSVISDDN